MCFVCLFFFTVVYLDLNGSGCDLCVEFSTGIDGSEVGGCVLYYQLGTGADTAPSSTPHACSLHHNYCIWWLSCHSPTHLI